MNANEFAEYALRQLIECLELHVPEKDCTCRLIQAPCDDCINHTQEREALTDAKRAIGRLQVARGYLPVQR